MVNITKKIEAYLEAYNTLIFLYSFKKYPFWLFEDSEG